MVGVALMATAGNAQDKVTLSNGQLDVDVSLEGPRVLSYRLKATGGEILGSLGKGTPSVEVSKRGQAAVTVEWQALSPKIVPSADAVVYSCTAKLGEVTAVTFDYAIRLKGNVVTIGTENIKEADGYDLNAFLFPADPIIRVLASDPSARVCVGNLGETRANPDSHLVRPGEPLDAEFHFGLVYAGNVAAGIYSNSLYRKDTKPVQTLVADGTTGLFTNNHRYSYKDENYEPFLCQVGIVADVNGDKAIDWKDAACFIHDAIPHRVKLRQECIKYMCNHGTDFEYFPENVARKICNLADGHPQMVLLAGWNGWGWDSEYPTWDQPGEEYGGREGLYKLHENSYKYRAYTSMIHNFDDAYKGTRMWSDAIIARKADGELLNATWWSGGPSYIIGPYRFWKSGQAKATIDGLIAQGEERQMFSDVFTIIPWRDDLDSADPADPETNLVMGKFKILDYLASKDIYMNSEGFNYMMLGRYIGAHNGYDAGLNRNLNQPPLAWFICHGLLTKKMWSPTDEGRFRGEDTEVPSPFSADNLYRWSMLLSFYGDKPIRDFKVIEGGYSARYGDDVEVVWNQGPAATRPTTRPAGERGMRGRGEATTGGVTVTLSGAKIADHRSVLLPKADLGKDMWNVLRAYSVDGLTMRYPKPRNWTDIKQLTALALTMENLPTSLVANASMKMGEGELRVTSSTVEGDTLKVQAVSKDGKGVAGDVSFKVAFVGDELVIDIPRDQPVKLVYGPGLLVKETVFEPLKINKNITYPLDEVVLREGGDGKPADQRPEWIRLRTRKQMTLPADVTLAVGASASWPTKEEARKHAAWIVARKMAWNLRETYVEHGHTRSYEQLAGVALKETETKLGYQNWYLGHVACERLLTVAGLNARPGTQWYYEKVKYGPGREEGWKAFVCTPFTPEQAREIYLQAARDRIAECQALLQKSPTPVEKLQLELNIKVYQILLNEEPKKKPEPIKFQV